MDVRGVAQGVSCCLHVTMTDAAGFRCTLEPYLHGQRVIMTGYFGPEKGHVDDQDVHSLDVDCRHTCECMTVLLAVLRWPKLPWGVAYFRLQASET